MAETAAILSNCRRDHKLKPKVLLVLQLDYHTAEGPVLQIAEERRSCRSMAMHEAYSHAAWATPQQTRCLERPGLVVMVKPRRQGEKSIVP
jgi:hypothetical protein